MRRFGRWTFHALTALSLLLCVATVVVWVRTRFTSDRVLRVAPSGFQVFETREGTVELDGVVAYTIIYPPPMGWSYKRGEPERPDDPRAWAFSHRVDKHWTIGRAGFWTAPMRAGSEVAYTQWFLVLPCWLLGAMFAILPAGRITLYFLPRRREKRGVCRHCFYDLTANVSGVCPECGSAVARGAT